MLLDNSRKKDPTRCYENSVYCLLFMGYKQPFLQILSKYCAKGCSLLQRKVTLK
ncbi:MAG: hypothetical protein E7024_02630 [Succinivibrio dextrinosolvens]|nr:hypothetical protein [Succinivibrio dextrinosolvens]